MKGMIQPSKVGRAGQHMASPSESGLEVTATEGCGAVGAANLPEVRLCAAWWGELWRSAAG